MGAVGSVRPELDVWAASPTAARHWQKSFRQPEAARSFIIQVVRSLAVLRARSVVVVDCEWGAQAAIDYLPLSCFGGGKSQSEVPKAKLGPQTIAHHWRTGPLLVSVLVVAVQLLPSQLFEDEQEEEDDDDDHHHFHHLPLALEG